VRGVTVRKACDFVPRLTSYSIAFTGIKIRDSDEELEYYIRIGPQCVDTDNLGRPIQYYMEPARFQRDLNKGLSSNAKDPSDNHVFPPPSANGRISFPELSLARLDFSNVTAVTLTMACTGYSKTKGFED
jgi:hypothetical protein